jgi:hypothetical protein
MSRPTITEMDYTGQLKTAITKACPSTALPNNIGLTLGRVLYNIKQLVELHLENPIDFQLPVPEHLQETPELIHAITSHMAHLREVNDIPTALQPIPLDVYDRKASAKLRKCKKKHVWLVDVHFKRCVLEVLGGLFASWDPVKTQEFNKGAERALNRTVWETYPGVNVALKAGEGDWAEWLEEECFKLNLSKRETWKLCDER